MKIPPVSTVGWCREESLERLTFDVQLQRFDNITPIAIAAAELHSRTHHLAIAVHMDCAVFLDSFLPFKSPNEHGRMEGRTWHIPVMHPS